ncbi:MAG: FIVAR domain-containing protein, partial [Bifidobacteriaceae bacterium]|nr:FIVAR domain-containing protein [Bifidobacteriaceae bacterium]
WDVDTGAYIVEPGAYSIRAAKSAADAGTATALTVTAAQGATPAAARSLNRQVLAETFDDYSNFKGDTSDIELVSSSLDFHSNTAVQFRQDGGWINFKNVAVPAGATKLTVKAGSDRASNLKVYAVPPGTDPATLAGLTPITAITLGDTRPVSGLPTGLGIGPIAVKDQTFLLNRPYPGTPKGQNDLDPAGQPHKDAYVKPDWQTLYKNVAIPAGNHDIYIVADRRGPRVEWLKLGSAFDEAQSVAISNAYNLDSIRADGGTLELRADLTPGTSVDEVTWRVRDLDGATTSLATITQAGLLRASGSANGSVRVRATADSGVWTEKVIPITNQLDSDKVAIDGQPKTIDYITLRTGAAYGPTDSIQRHRGTNLQTVVASELFSENPDNYYLGGTYLTVPNSEFDWTIAGADGQPTELATVDAAGLVTATGQGDGDVVVTAVLKGNPLVFAARTITLQNQGYKNPAKVIQAENYDATTAEAATATTWAMGGNEMGLYVPFAAGSAWTYKNVDFATMDLKSAAVRLASGAAGATAGAVEVWIDGPTAADGGTRLTSVGVTTPANQVEYQTYAGSIPGSVSGVHDVYLVTNADFRVNWFSFAGTAGSNLVVLQAALAAYADYLNRESEYTPGSFQAFRTAYSAGQAIVAAGTATESVVAAAITALQTAVAGLAEAVDTSVLTGLIEAAEAILADSGSYIPASIAGLAAEVQAARDLIASPTLTPGEVVAAATSLARAISAAALKGDTSALEALAGFVDDLAQDRYTPASWAPVAAARTAANAVLTAAEPSAGQVETALGSLTSALNGLKLRASKAGLGTIIAVAEVIAANIGAYSPASVAGLPEALAAAQAIAADDDATSAQVASAQSALLAQVAGARLRAATGGLAAAVERAASSDLDSDSPAAAAVSAAATAGQTVLEDPDATQGEVDAAAGAVTGALAGLSPARVAKAPKVLKAPKAKTRGKAVAGAKS